MNDNLNYPLNGAEDKENISAPEEAAASHSHAAEEAAAEQEKNVEYEAVSVGYEEKASAQAEIVPEPTYNDAIKKESDSRSYQNTAYFSVDQSQYPYGNQGAYPYSGNNSYGNYNSYDNRQQPQGYPYSSQNHSYAYPSDGNNTNKGSRGTKIFGIVAATLCVFLAIALIAVIAGDKSPAVSGNENTTHGVSGELEEFVTNASPVTGNELTSEGELTPKSIYRKVLPSSVGVLVYNSSKALTTEGSGVLFRESEDGNYTFIITCAHVISGSSAYLRVRLYNGEEYDAQIVGYDVRTDIGVIRIKKTGLTLAEIGDSSKIEVGDYVYAIGNPGGVEFADSFTNGMVSALDRPVSSSSTGYTTECIQHTAAINPGNSGGALVNSFGQVIGINSMKIVDAEYEGMGFSVPSSVFVEIVNEILKHGYVSNRPKLGITLMYASEYSSYGMYVAIKGLPSGSIVIYKIDSDSALVDTKVQEGDMIVAVNGVPLDDTEFLAEYIEDLNVGDVITLSIVRIKNDYSAEEFEVSVPLVEDRGTSLLTEEETTASQVPGGSNGGNYGGSYGGYEDYFGQYFEDFFGSYFGNGR